MCEEVGVPRAAGAASLEGSGGLWREGTAPPQNTAYDIILAGRKAAMVMRMVPCASHHVPWPFGTRSSHRAAACHKRTRVPRLPRDHAIIFYYLTTTCKRQPQ